FDAVLVPFQTFAESADLNALIKACAESRLNLVLDLTVNAETYDDDCQHVLTVAKAVGVDGVAMATLVRGLNKLSTTAIRQVITGMSRTASSVPILVWAAGMRPDQVAALTGTGVAGISSSLPWWNYRDTWLVEEYERLRAVAPVLAPLADPLSPEEFQTATDELARRLAVAALVGDGLLVTEDQARELGPERLAEWISPVAQRSGGRGVRLLTGPLAPVTALFRGEAGGRVLLLNPRKDIPASLSRSLIERRLPNGYVLDADAAGHHFQVEPGGWRVLPLVEADWIARFGTSSRQERSNLTSAMRGSRIAIECVEPVIDGGRFAVKRILGETVVLRANIFMDGHEELAAELMWKPANASDWQRTPMQALGNDAWEAQIFPRKLGRYVFTVRAWVDAWRSFRSQLQKKHAAGVDVALEVEEARRMLRV